MKKIEFKVQPFESCSWRLMRSS